MTPNKPRPNERRLHMDFVGIDLEWASDVPGNVCEIGVVWFEGGREVASYRSLIQPIVAEWGTWQFLNLPYGLNDALRGPSFPEVWSTLEPKLSALPWVAHNAASAEARMLGAALAHHGMDVPAPAEVWCTLDLAKKAWPEFPAHGLHRMAAQLDLDLEHHNPESDARACSKLVLQAAQQLGADGFGELVDRAEWQPHPLQVAPPHLPEVPAAQEVFGVTLTAWESPAPFPGWEPGDRFVMSGLPEAVKHQIKYEASERGLQPVQSLNGRTAFVIAGSVMGPAKYRKCQTLGIPIISLEEWEARRGGLNR